MINKVVVIFTRFSLMLGILLALCLGCCGNAAFISFFHCYLAYIKLGDRHRQWCQLKSTERLSYL